MSILSKNLFAGFIFLLPLYYSFDTQQIFEVNKFWLLCIFTGVFSGITAFTIAFSRGVDLSRPQTSQSKKCMINHAPTDYSRNFWVFSGIFFLSILISSLLAQTPVTAFLGGTARHQGAIFLLMLFLIFIFIQIFFSENSRKSKQKNSTKKTIQNIQKFLIYPLLASAVISSIIAIKQSFGEFSGFSLSFFAEDLRIFDVHILEIKDISMRSFGSMGQPNFLAQFLLLPFFLSVYFVFINTKNIIKLVLFSGISGIIFYAIHSTGSRAGEYIGLGLGIFLLILLFVTSLFSNIQEKKQRIFWKISTMFLCLGIFLVGYIFYTPEILSHLGERARSVLARMQFWKEAIPLLTQDFKTLFFGLGGDNLGSAFQPIASVRLNELEGFSYSPDRAHTIFLDFILHYGIIAGVIFWGFILRIFWKTTQIIFSDTTEISEKILLSSIFAGLAATLGSWSVGFYVTTDATIFMIFLGILAVFIAKHASTSAGETNCNLSLQKNMWNPRRSKILISMLLILTSIIIFHTASITKNSDIARYQNTLSNKNPEKTLSQETIESDLENAPHLQENFLTLQSAETMKKAEISGFHSFSFYYQKFLFSRKKSDFENAKISAGNNLPSNISLFNLALSMSEQFNTFSEDELVEYAKEVYVMVPDKYYTPANWMHPEIQKFWKHHQDFVIILEWVDK